MQMDSMSVMKSRPPGGLLSTNVGITQLHSHWKASQSTWTSSSQQMRYIWDVSEMYHISINIVLIIEEKLHICYHGITHWSRHITLHKLWCYRSEGIEMNVLDCEPVQDPLVLSQIKTILLLYTVKDIRKFSSLQESRQQRAKIT